MVNPQNKAQTSITVDVDILERSRVFATLHGKRSLSALVEDLLRENLKKPAVIFETPGVDKLEEVGV